MNKNRSNYAAKVNQDDFLRKSRPRYYVPPDRFVEAQRVQARYGFLWDVVSFRPEMINGLFESCWDTFTFLGNFLVEKQDATPLARATGSAYTSIVELLKFETLRSVSDVLSVQTIVLANAESSPEQDVWKSEILNSLGDVLRRSLIRWSRYWNVESDWILKFAYNVLLLVWQEEKRQLPSRPSKFRVPSSTQKSWAKSGIGSFASRAQGKKEVSAEHQERWQSCWKKVLETETRAYFVDCYPANLYQRRLGNADVPKQWPDQLRRECSQEKFSIIKKYHQEHTKQLKQDGWRLVKSVPDKDILWLTSRRLPVYNHQLIEWDILAKLEAENHPHRYKCTGKKAKQKEARAHIQSRVRELLKLFPEWEIPPTFRAKRGRPKNPEKETTIESLWKKDWESFNLID